MLPPESPPPESPPPESPPLGSPALGHPPVQSSRPEPRPVGSQPGLTVLVRLLDPELPLPAYALPGDAGADIVSRVDLELGPGERAVVPTGIAVAVPEGYAAFVHPRSGLAARHGLTLVNAPGTIDSGYRGEIMLVMLNTDREASVRLRRGDRVAQLVIQPVQRASFRAVVALPESARGSGGRGSTGGFAAAAPPVPAGSGAG